MPATYPAFQVSVAYGIAASAVPAGGDWVDESVYVSSISTKTGRRDEFTQPSAGQVSLAFNNSSGRFDPDNTTGAHYGQLLPLVWVRIMGGTTTANTGVFYGQVSIEGWRLSASQFKGDVDVTVDVIDMFEQLANTDLPTSVYAIEVKADTPTAWYRLGEQSGTIAADSSTNGRNGTYEGGATFNTRTGLIANESNNAIGFDGVDDTAVLPAASQPTGDTTVELWLSMAAVGANDQVLWEHTSTAGVFTLLAVSGTAGSAGTLFVQQAVDAPSAAAVRTGTLRVDDGRTHHIVLTLSATAVRVTIDGTLNINGAAFATQLTTATRAVLGYGTGGYTTTVIAGNGRLIGTMDEAAMYAGVLSAARITAHYNAGTIPWRSDLTSARITHILDSIAFPATLRTIATGNSTMPAATLNTDALSALLDVNKAEGGELYIDHYDAGKLRFRNRQARWTDTRSVTSQATFGDSGAELTYSSIDIQDDRIVNEANVQRFGGSTVTARDATSATTYQRRSYSETGLLVESDTEVQDRADLIVGEKKTRARRVRSITLEPRKSTHLAWPQVFARQIGDRITVKWRPPYGGTYSYDSWIIGIAHRWTPRSGLRTTFHLQPVPYGATAEPYWILDTSTLGTTTRLGV